MTISKRVLIVEVDTFISDFDLEKDRHAFVLEMRTGLQEQEQEVQK